MKEIKLELIKSGEFLGMSCDFYKDEDNNIYMTREQVGQALEYKTPDDAIRRMHNQRKNKKRLDQLSIKVRVMRLEGDRKVTRNTVFYTEQGILFIMRISTQPIEYKYNLLKSIGYDDVLANAVLGTTSITLSQQNDLYSILKKTFYDCDLKSEVVMGKYRADFVLNDEIIIECDEDGHRQYDIVEEERRENYLKRKGYKVLRYNPNSVNNKEELKEIVSNISNILKEHYAIKYPEKLFHDYSNDLIIRMNTSKRLWGGYIYDADGFAERFKSVFPDKEKMDEFKILVREAKQKQDSLLDEMLI